MEIDLYVYRNPRPPLTTTTLYWAAKAYPKLYEGLDRANVRLNEYIGGLEPNSSWTEALISWHRQTNNWIPKEILEWWLPWFDIDSNLEPMPLSWWHQRALAFVVARVKEEIIGVATLTVVIGDGKQGTGTFLGTELCYEIRGAVITPAFRGRGVFRYLVEELLVEARMLGRYPTFLATRNHRLREALLRRESTPRISSRRDSLDNGVCWHTPFNESCTECPLLPGNSIWWETDLPLPPGELRDRFLFNDG